MTSNTRISITGSELIHVLGLDPYYGFKLNETKFRKAGANETAKWEALVIGAEQNKRSHEKAPKPVQFEQEMAKHVYEAEVSVEAESILESIYEKNSSRDEFRTFKCRFERLPCKAELLRQLIYLWCGLLGLPYVRNEQGVNNQESDILKNWTKDFEIDLDELKTFLRLNSWPLPVRIFRNEPDNTKNIIDMMSEDYVRFCEHHIEVLPRLRKSLKDLGNVAPSTVAEREAILEEKSKLEKNIRIILEGGDPDKRPSRKESRNDNIWKMALEFRDQKHPPSWRWIARKLASMDVAEGLSEESVRSMLKKYNKN